MKLQGLPPTWSCGLPRDDPSWHEACSVSCDYHVPREPTVLERLLVWEKRAFRSAARARWWALTLAAVFTVNVPWAAPLCLGLLMGLALMGMRQRMKVVNLSGELFTPMNAGHPSLGPYRGAVGGLRKLTPEELAIVTQASADRARKWALFAMGMTLATILMTILRLFG